MIDTKRERVRISRGFPGSRVPSAEIGRLTNRRPPDFAFNDDKSARPRLVRVNLVIEPCQLRIASWTKVRARSRSELCTIR